MYILDIFKKLFFLCIYMNLYILAMCLYDVLLYDKFDYVYGQKQVCKFIGTSTKMYYISCQMRKWF